MGIFSDDRVDFLEEERQKIWAKVISLEEQSHAIREESRILKEQSQLFEEALSKKTSDYETEAKSAAKKAVECKNKCVAAKESITEIVNTANDDLEAIIAVQATINSINLQITEIAGSAKDNHNEVVALCKNIQDRKTILEEQVIELEEVFEKHDTYLTNISTLEALAKKGEETSAKIDTLHRHLLNKKKEIDELYVEVFGYTEEDEKTGEETKVPGLKHELDEAYDGLRENLNNIQEDLTEHKKKQIHDSITFAKQKEAQFNNTLKRWGGEFSILSEKIKSLLPDALTAGLSHAYSSKKSEEIEDSKNLTKKFIGGIIGMICVSLIPFAISVYLYAFRDKTPEDVIDIIPRIVIAILPLYIPVLWLAYSANKSLNLSKRLIEEYTHKEVLSKTFEGLSRQIENLDDEDISSDLRIRLLYNILEVNSENPGKLITDYNKADHPLMDALDKSVKLGNAVGRLAEFPGMSRLAGMMERKAKRILSENMKKAEEGFDVIDEDVVNDGNEQQAQNQAKT